jgi:hypothetical protein
MYFQSTESDMEMMVYKYSVGLHLIQLANKKLHFVHGTCVSVCYIL